MAKNTKDALDEGADDAAPVDAPKGLGKKKLVLLGAFGLVVIGLLGGTYVFFLGGKSDDATNHAAAKKPAAFIEVREMMVNLAPETVQDRTRLLRFKISLEVSDPKLISGITPLMPRVEDSLQVYVRELRASDLEGSIGLYRLREELLRRVNYAVYPAKIDAVLFKDIVVQ